MTQRQRIQLVKKRLWGRGYRVEDYTDKPIIDFDLLVQNKYAVMVGAKKPKEIVGRCDIFIEVDAQGNITYIKGSQREKSPPVVFGKN